MAMMMVCTVLCVPNVSLPGLHDESFSSLRHRDLMFVCRRQARADKVQMLT
jgi:hypothetical protein